MMRILSDNFTSKSCKEVKDVDCKISYQLFNFFFVNKTGYWFQPIRFSDVLCVALWKVRAHVYGINVVMFMVLRSSWRSRNSSSCVGELW